MGVGAAYAAQAAVRRQDLERFEGPNGAPLVDCRRAGRRPVDGPAAILLLIRQQAIQESLDDRVAEEAPEWMLRCGRELQRSMGVG
jgi:hypothetical protein